MAAVILSASPEASDLERRVLETRNTRKQDAHNRLTRLKKIRDIYAGEFITAFPNEFSKEDTPKIANQVQTGVDDIANLVSESVPIVRCDAEGDKEQHITNANVREAIAMGYWLSGDYLSILPAQLSMDLTAAGAAFLLVWAMQEEEYPVFMRLDPGSCFPLTYGNMLVDLLVTTQVPTKTAMGLFPDLNVEGFAEGAREVEIVDFYEKEAVSRVLIARAGPQYGNEYGTDRAPEGYVPPAKSLFVSWEENFLGKVPVAWAKRETLDQEFRGIFDQVPNTMLIQNQIVELMLDYAEQQAYAPIVAKNVANIHETPGPTTIYQLMEDGSMGRLAPAGQSPQLFAILEYLERQSRAGAMQPASRAGEVSQSIASASFVSATMGQLTSTVRSVQRHLSKLMGEANRLAYLVDEKKLNFEKPLLHPIEGRKVYTPAKDIKGRHRNRVVFGAGAGLDLLNRSVMILNDLGARLISRETAREQKDYIHDPRGEEMKIDRENSKDALTQKLIAEADVPTLIEIGAEFASGKDIYEALLALREKAVAAQAAVEAQPVLEAAVPGAPPEPTAPVPGQAPAEAEVNLPLPPTTQVIISPPRQ